MRNTVYFIGLFIASVTGAGAKLCWTGQWFNSTSPEFNGGSDFESQSPALLKALCPDGGPVAAHCKDEKGEPMTGFKDDVANHYIVNCTVSGFQCHPYKNTAGAKCADFAIEYACNCPTTTPPSTISGVVTHAPGLAVSTSGAIGNAGSTIGLGDGAGGTTGGSGIGGSPSTTGSGGSSTLNASGGGSSGSGSGGGEGSNKSSTENAAGGNSAFGGSCTCKNGSNKISVAIVPMLLSVLFKLL